MATIQLKDSSEIRRVLRRKMSEKGYTSYVYVENSKELIEAIFPDARPNVKEAVVLGINPDLELETSFKYARSYDYTSQKFLEIIRGNSLKISHIYSYDG